MFSEASQSAPRHRLRVRSATAGVLLGSLVAVADTGGAARADVVYVPWSTYLSGWTGAHVPTSANDCAAGRPTCVKHTIKELNKVLQDTGPDCHHHAVFALSYTRITQTFAWSTEQPGYYEDVPFAIHQGAVFAKYYTDAWQGWRKDKREDVPKSWLTALDAAAEGKVTGTGDLLLAMNAHINRDLPYVVAEVGLVAPDGSSRKPDYDKVEHFLAAAAKPMIAEAAQRFDPSMDDSADPLDAAYSLVMQMISAGREKAWRNAEALVSAPTPEDRALVEAKIESDANMQAQAILTAYQYQPPLTSSTARDDYCAVHNADPAPLSYPFGTPEPYRT